ncbi:MAG TPA: phosphatase PAP2 family protein, partial [Acidimicrobiales bacterium]|nr:phosphatase PAP2 family protein [Acidimicrobiales bacterium]
GLWSFDSGTMQKISNQYAAMPSLHFAWSSWSALVLLPGVRKSWLRVLLVIYPFATLFAIVVTANHYWLDAAGGAFVLTVGYSIARLATPYLSKRAAARQRETGQTDTASSMPLK